jgi:hypothetical protein
MTLRTAMALALTGVMVAGTALADEPRPPVPIDGLVLPAHVRLTLADGRRLSYELLQVRGDALEVRRSGRVPEPSSTILRAEVRGMERRLGGRGSGPWWGALVGAAVGVAVCAALNSAEDGPELGYTLPRVALPLTAAGAGIGVLVSREQWGPVDLGRIGPGGLHSSQASGPRALLAWSVRF